MKTCTGSCRHTGSQFSGALGPLSPRMSLRFFMPITNSEGKPFSEDSGKPSASSPA
ncbi:MAG: DUF2403 domain-containing protein [Proteobacteria bacterium]|nr:DUF2403 domain-containing protein [Pseudomonadota bacterium]